MAAPASHQPAGKTKGSGAPAPSCASPWHSAETVLPATARDIGWGQPCLGFARVGWSCCRSGDLIWCLWVCCGVHTTSSDRDSHLWGPDTMSLPWP